MSLVSPERPPDLDLFCKVVDNFGDIGVSWRLARDLARYHGLAVRLWVDDWNAFARLHPLAIGAADAIIAEGVAVHRWVDPLPDVVPAPVVVEAFACELPERYLAAMAAREPRPVWINFEYLSAEDWVAGCHGLASPHARLPLVKHFFFPGFTDATGGLLREPDLFARRDAFQADARAREDFLRSLGVPAAHAGALTVSLFGYEQPALHALLRAWADGDRPVSLLVPEGRLVASVAGFFGAADAPVGRVFERGALTAVVLPFVPQDDYDRLLWACDVNFVRGEDSFVRAQWAARPFVWHIYRQEEDAHLPKLRAFLAHYLGGMSAAAADAVRELWWAWNGDGALGAAWPTFHAALDELRAYNRSWASALAAQRDLASALVQFCKNKV